MDPRTPARRPVTRAALTAALATATCLGAALPATAAPAAPAAAHHRTTATGGGWSQDGLRLNPADNAAVDAYLARARRAERDISPRIRAAALLTHATVVGFEQRLKSPDSLKRKVATRMRETPGQSVQTSLAMINDAVRYTLQWPTGQYTRGVTAAAGLLSSWGDDSTRWSNTWGRPKGYKGINSAWRAPRSGQVFEVQFHTPRSKAAQLETHKLYEEQRLPGTPPERVRELQARQDAIFAAVPVPAGADRLSAPVRRVPAPAPAPLPARAVTA
ncbi:ATP nucleotide 3'-pyrophosphokinase [Streptomyces sp. NRRL F-4489]|uniref:ATP nucleotide 3'-pyrophosphokinase n=1 Tax=Streptomyces sp. NRRL F-4489 TaxID=1609095 RepID=UPI000749B2B0|nr:ATP nucleotide 3'-pyrophosphokinase [Streptomyces sp. NRRL F-4489]KUL36218.1 ATP nucleotide 3'-pyrophosphokinase [Streptomyces sp. NRRL F-4489]